MRVLGWGVRRCVLGMPSTPRGSLFLGGLPRAPIFSPSLPVWTAQRAFARPAPAARPPSYATSEEALRGLRDEDTDHDLPNDEALEKEREHYLTVKPDHFPPGSQTAADWVKLEDYREAGETPPIELYHSILRSYLRKEWIGRAILVLEQMEEQGPAPTIESYNLVLRVLVEREQIETASNILASLMERGMALNQEAMELLFQLAWLMNDRGLQSDLQETMAHLELPYNRPAYQANVALYAHTGHPDEAYAFIDRLAAAQELLPDTQTCNFLLEAHASEGDLPAIQRVMGLMERFHLSPNFVTYEHLMQAYLTGAHYQEVERLFDEMQETLQYRSVRAHALLLQAYFADGQPDQGMQVFQDAFDSGVELDEALYLAALQGLVGAARWEELGAVYRQYLRSDLPFSEEIFECMLGGQLQAQNYEEVQALLDYAQDCQWEFQPSTFLLLIDGCIRNGLHEQALVYMSEMRDNFPEFEPTREFYDKILGHSEGGISLTQIMKALGVSEPPVTIKEAARQELQRGQAKVEAYLKELAALRGEDIQLSPEDWEDDEDLLGGREEEEDDLEDSEGVQEGEDRRSVLPPILHYPEHPMMRRLRKERTKRPPLRNCVAGSRAQ